MRFNHNNYPGAPWLNLIQQPRNHLNMKNNAAMIETAGEINGFYATVQVSQPSGFSLGTGATSESFACDFFAEAMNGQVYPMRMVSPLSTLRRFELSLSFHGSSPSYRMGTIVLPPRPFSRRIPAAYKSRRFSNKILQLV